MRPLLATLLLLLLLLLPGPLAAVEPDEILQDAALEARARVISAELRCLVCQNQSIDDSNAPLARDLRVLVRERLTAGDSNGQVMDYVVARYGHFVLLRPPLAAATLLLWLAPAGIVLVAGVLLYRRSRRAGQAAPAALTAEEQGRLAEIVRSSGR